MSKKPYASDAGDSNETTEATLLALTTQIHQFVVARTLDSRCATKLVKRLKKEADAVSESGQCHENPTGRRWRRRSKQSMPHCASTMRAYWSRPTRRFGRLTPPPGNQKVTAARNSRRLRTHTATGRQRTDTVARLMQGSEAYGAAMRRRQPAEPTLQPVPPMFRQEDHHDPTSQYFCARCCPFRLRRGPAVQFGLRLRSWAHLPVRAGLLRISPRLLRSFRRHQCRHRLWRILRWWAWRTRTVKVRSAHSSGMIRQAHRSNHEQ